MVTNIKCHMTQGTRKIHDSYVYQIQTHFVTGLRSVSQDVRSKCVLLVMKPAVLKYNTKQMSKGRLKSGN